MPTLTTHEKVERFRYLLKFRWRCDVPGCDGLPHKGFPHNHARGNQVVPSNTPLIMFMTGRGFGKTRSAAQRVAERMMEHPKHRATIVAPTFAVGRDVCIEGESGLLRCFPEDRVKTWNRSTGELVLTNGSRAKLYSVANYESAEKIRGSQSHTLWCEEVSTWRSPHGWDMAKFANRLTGAPGGTQTIVTCTPKNTPLMRKLMNLKDMVMVNGSTLENAGNLSAEYVDFLRTTYEGTRLGEQELEGKLLLDQAGALWNRDIITEVLQEPAEYVRIVVGVDPAGGHREGSNAQTGIIVVGMDAKGRCYVMEDASGHYTAEQWAAKAAEMYDKYEADAVVVERNFGGDMVTSNLKAYGSTGLHIREVTASRGKALRAEPIVTLYENGRVVHIGAFADLEQQMCQWVPKGRSEVDEHGVETPIEASNYSPDRIDALVWAVTDLAIHPKANRKMTYRGQ